MIARKHRFHGHKSVTRVRGGRLQSQGFKVFYAKNHKGDYRMAVIVSKKTAKSAVVRNRIRRRFYESVRKQQLLNGFAVDAVFVVQHDTLATIPAGELDIFIAKACAKITATLK